MSSTFNINCFFFRFFELFRKLGGEKDGRLKIKKPIHMQEILDIVRKLVHGYETDKSLQPIKENKTKLSQMKTVLEMYVLQMATFSVFYVFVVTSTVA